MELKWREGVMGCGEDSVEKMKVSFERKNRQRSAREIHGVKISSFFATVVPKIVSLLDSLLLNELYKIECLKKLWLKVHRDTNISLKE